MTIFGERDLGVGLAHRQHAAERFERDRLGQIAELLHKPAVHHAGVMFNPYLVLINDQDFLHRGHPLAGPQLGRTVREPRRLRRYLDDQSRIGEY